MGHQSFLIKSAVAEYQPLKMRGFAPATRGYGFPEGSVPTTTMYGENIADAFKTLGWGAPAKYISKPQLPVDLIQALREPKALSSAHRKYLTGELGLTPEQVRRVSSVKIPKMGIPKGGGKGWRSAYLYNVLSKKRALNTALGTYGALGLGGLGLYALSNALSD